MQSNQRGWLARAIGIPCRARTSWTSGCIPPNMWAITPCTRGRSPEQSSSFRFYQPCSSEYGQKSFQAIVTLHGGSGGAHQWHAKELCARNSRGWCRHFNQHTECQLSVNQGGVSPTSGATHCSESTLTVAIFADHFYSITIRWSISCSEGTGSIFWCEISSGVATSGIKWESFITIGLLLSNF